MVKKLVEVYFANSFVGDKAFTNRYGDKYQLVDFYNETALQLSSQFRIQLPPVIGQITRANLPEQFGIRCASAVTRSDKSGATRRRAAKQIALPIKHGTIISGWPL